MNWKTFRGVAFFCVGLTAAPVVLAATARPVQQAQSMMAKGDYSAALKTLDGYLESAPQDADARFTKGLVLTKLQHTDAAIKVFSALTRDYPQLPEPYNNLAVLYAQKGQYDMASAALKAALATHPSYATAAENLGDVYAAMASQAYSRALKLDKSNQQVRYKLSLINRLNTPAGSQSTVPVAVASASAPASESAPSVASSSESVTETASPSTEVAAENAAPTAAEEQETPATDSSADQNLGAQERSAVVAAVRGWADAWSRQDVDVYLSHYAADFAKPGMSRDAWVAQRKDRLSAPKHISVRLSHLDVTPVDAQNVRVSFHQAYTSDSYSDQTDKVLELSDAAGDGWKIVSEAVVH